MWRRLPTWFPNIRLTLLPVTEEQSQQLLDLGWLREAAFRTEPRVNKFEIKEYLEKVHGMQVERVNTINYQGKKKAFVVRGKVYYKRMSDWKKAYVTFKPPKDDPKIQEWVQKWREQKQQQKQEEYDRWRKQQQKQYLVRQKMKESLLPTPSEVARLAERSKQAALTAGAGESHARERQLS